MTATDELRELAARMEGLALDTPDMLREAADAIDVLHESERRLMTQRNERLAKAEAENAKLREERDRLLMNANPTANELRRVRTAWKKDRAENAKLRELVKAMEPFLCCMPFASCNTLAANVRKRMRELGIEVDKCMGQ